MYKGVVNWRAAMWWDFLSAFSWVWPVRVRLWTTCAGSQWPVRVYMRYGYLPRHAKPL